MALSADRHTPRTDSTLFDDPVAAATIIYAGALVALDASGNAVPATATVAQRTRGVAQTGADNSAGAAGDVTVSVRRGVFRFDNSAVDAITTAHIGATAYVVDDQTVANTNIVATVDTRPPAGTIRNVDADGVWVEI